MSQFQNECQCAGEAINPGQAGCIPMVSRDKFQIFFQYKDSTGTLNGIPAGTDLTQAFLIARLNHVDADKRWFIAPEIFSVEAPNPEVETENRDGISIPTDEQLKQPYLYQHSKDEANPALIAFYDSIKCFDLGVLTITRTGQIAGMNDGVGNLVGVHLQKGTLAATYGTPVKGSLQKIMVSYLVDELENDANRDYIKSSQITFPTSDWFAVQPLEILAHELSNLGTVLFILDKLFGSVGRKAPCTGILSADFSTDNGATTSEAFNVTQDVAVGFTVVESSSIPGQYVGTFGTVPAPGDIMDIDIFKEGVHMRTLRIVMLAS